MTNDARREEAVPELVEGVEGLDAVRGTLIWLRSIVEKAGKGSLPENVDARAVGRVLAAYDAALAKARKKTAALTKERDTLSIKAKNYASFNYEWQARAEKAEAEIASERAARERAEGDKAEQMKAKIGWERQAVAQCKRADAAEATADALKRAVEEKDTALRLIASPTHWSIVDADSAAASIAVRIITEMQRVASEALSGNVETSEEVWNGYTPPENTHELAGHLASFANDIEAMSQSFRFRIACAIACRKAAGRLTELQDKLFHCSTDLDIYMSLTAAQGEGEEAPKPGEGLQAGDEVLFCPECGHVEKAPSSEGHSAGEGGGLPEGWLATELEEVEKDVARWPDGLRKSFESSTGIPLPPATLRPDLLREALESAPNPHLDMTKEYGDWFWGARAEALKAATGVHEQTGEG